MLRWYDLSLLNLVTCVIFIMLDRKYTILPLTYKSAKIFGIYIACVILFWVLVVGQYWGFEGTAAQIKQFVYSMIAMWPINALAARFLLGKRKQDI
jgi:hypothetical protein